MPRPPKAPRVMLHVRAALLADAYTLTEHAKLRLVQRGITVWELRQALELGHHEKSKDHFDGSKQAWAYAVRGRADERRDLRVVVALHEGMVIITAIDLTNEGADED